MKPNLRKQSFPAPSNNQHNFSPPFSQLPKPIFTEKSNPVSSAPSPRQSSKYKIPDQQQSHQLDTNMQNAPKTHSQDQQDDCYLSQDEAEDHQIENGHREVKIENGQKQEKREQKNLSHIKLESSQQIHHASVSQSEKKKRKIRTTITVEKLKEMNKVFEEYKRNPNGNIKLKEISQKLGLGYSTVLHKYKQFKKTNKVKGGALIQSKFQKRKYKKSLEIEHYINKALESGDFFTANQLASYIRENYGKDYSRSIISRHLGEMGYSYKNIKNQEKDSQDEGDSVQVLVDEQVVSIKKQEIFSQAVLKLIENKEKLLFLQEIHFQIYRETQQDAEGHSSKRKKQSFSIRRLPFPHTQPLRNMITLVFVANEQQILFYRFEKGPYGHNQFYQHLKEIIQTLEMSNPSSEVGKQELEKDPLPQISDIIDFEDFQKDIFFQHEPQIKHQQQPRQQIVLENTEQKHKLGQSFNKQTLQTSKQSSIQPRFLVLNFEPYHKDNPDTEQSQNLFQLFSSYRIIPLYIPSGWQQKLNMLQLWYKIHLEKLLEKKFKTEKHFRDQCQEILLKNAYNVRDTFQKVKETMEDIVENYQLREKYVQKLDNQKKKENNDKYRSKSEYDEEQEVQSEQDLIKQEKIEAVKTTPKSKCLKNK